MDSRSKSRVLLTWLLLVAFVAIQSAAAMDIHDHQHAGSHTRCCAACHAGYLPALQTEGTVQVAPPSATEWQAASADVSLIDLHLFSPDSSRAPPAIILSHS